MSEKQSRALAGLIWLAPQCGKDGKNPLYQAPRHNHGPASHRIWSRWHRWDVIVDSELPSLVYVGYKALLARLGAPFGRSRSAAPTRILVAPHLRLGDALLLTPLLAKLREQYPAAQIVLICAPPLLTLYQSLPYGVTVWPYHPRKLKTISAMLADPGFDLAIIPGDNRHVWLASALRSKWIVAHAGGGAFKSWMADELIDYPDQPASMSEIFAALCPGPAPRLYQRGDWPQPAFTPFELPPQPYAVLHIGASTKLKYWPAPYWRELADWLVKRGITPVWSGGPGEDHLVEQVDPAGQYHNYAGKLDLAQIWALMAKAELFVSPDTGVAHLARLTGVPSVAIFGPADVTLFGKAGFWDEMPCVEVGKDGFPCRDQHVVFDRYRAWIKTCNRSLQSCKQPGACMGAVEPLAVIEAIQSLLVKQTLQVPALGQLQASE